MLSKTLITLSVLASSVFALTFTSAPSTVVAGSTYTLTYTTDDTTDPVSIVLRKGNPAALDTIGTLTSTATGGSYSWTVAANLVSGTDYALEILQGTVVNYYGPFSLTGGSTAPSSTSSGSLSASISASGSSSSGSLSQTSSAKVSTSSHVGNSTVTTKSTVSTSLSTSKITSSSAGATATSAPNSASSISSPLALILGAVAAMFYLH